MAVGEYVVYERASKWLFLKIAIEVVNTVKEPSNWMKPRNPKKHAGVAFKNRYHKRSNAESTNSAFKRKFGDILASRKWNMQKIETGIRVVIYNIRLLIRYRIRTEMELLD